MVYNVTVSKGVMTYEVEADSPEVALEIAEDYYNEKGFTEAEVVRIK